MESNLSVADALALRQPGSDANGFGGNGAFLWVFLIILLAGGGFGWGNRNQGADASVQRDFIQRDIFSTNQNVSNTACQTQRDIFDTRYAQQQCCCDTQKEIIESRYQNALSFKDQMYAQQQCCCETNRNIDSIKAEAYRNTCDITNAIHAEGEQTRALINSHAMQDLRDKVEERDRQLMTANFQLSQQGQSQYILGQLGKYGTNAPVWQCSSLYGCGNI